jgi:alkylation response protein AidB-like acyl-CoA dehydrogenase
MKFDFNQGQNILKESARKLLSNECTTEFVREMAAGTREFPEELWGKMAELGWMTLLIPEQHGGSGFNFLDLSIILYEMGYHCMPGPFFSTVVQGGLSVLEAGTSKQKATILPEIAEGKHKLTLAWLETEGVYDREGIALSAVREDDRFVLTGTKLFVQDAESADTIICAARTLDTDGTSDGITLFLVDTKLKGLEVTRLLTMSGDRQYDVRFNRVDVPETCILGKLNQGWTVLDSVLQKSAVATCAEMTGGAQKVMDIVIPYAKGRKQFGRPIGAFQSIQHHCANMLTFAETMRFMTFQTAWRITEGAFSEMDASICKAWVSDAYRQMVALGHQVVGGVGFMEEFDLQLYFRQAKCAQQRFGDGDYHRERVAETMGL